DRGLLLGKPDLPAFFIEQKLLTWLERIGANRKFCILGLLVMAYLGTNAGEQNGKAKRLGHIIISTGLQPQHGVGVGILRRQHDDGRAKAALAKELHSLPSV